MYESVKEWAINDAGLPNAHRAVREDVREFRRDETYPVMVLES